MAWRWYLNGSQGPSSVAGRAPGRARLPGWVRLRAARRADARMSSPRDGPWPGPARRGRPAARAPRPHPARQALFEQYGALARLVLPPSHTLAVAEFVEARGAAAAFRGLAYRRYHHVPLYLEWAPARIFDAPPPPQVVPSSCGWRGDGRVAVAGFWWRARLHAPLLHIRLPAMAVVW